MMSSDALIQLLTAKSRNEDEPDTELLRIAAMRLKHVEEALAFVGSNAWTIELKKAPKFIFEEALF